MNRKVINRIKKLDINLLVILTIALLFRFYNFKELQYWSLDEELLTATVRHIVWDRSPTLLVQNVAISFGLGPYYHYFLTPFFVITNFNLVFLQAVASALGLLTVVIVYLCGKIIGGKKVGYIAALLYASSFLISFFDRRLFHLSLDSVLSAIALFVILKLIQKEYRYFPLLALPVGFSFHADPSLAVVTIAILLSLFIFKISLKHKSVLYFMLILAIFFAPFLGAEIIYGRSVVNPVVNSLLKPLKEESISPVTFVHYDPKNFIEVLGRIIAVAPSKFVEKNFEYSKTYAKPLLSPIPEAIAIALLLFYFYCLFRSRADEKKYILAVFIFFASFILGILIFNLVFKGAFYQHYFTVIFPIVVVMFAYSLSKIFGRRNGLLAAFAVLLVLLNLYSMLNSQIKYPLYRKIELVRKIADKLESGKFAIDAIGDTWVQSGGWTELFTLQRKFAVKSFSYEYLDWIYRAYSLYPGPIQKEDPERIVFVKLSSEPSPYDLPVISKETYKDMGIILYDNSKNNLRR